MDMGRSILKQPQIAIRYKEPVSPAAFYNMSFVSTCSGVGTGLQAAGNVSIYNLRNLLNLHLLGMNRFHEIIGPDQEFLAADCVC
jgi:hypothetical protein